MQCFSLLLLGDGYGTASPPLVELGMWVECNCGEIRSDIERGCDARVYFTGKLSHR